VKVLLVRPVTPERVVLNVVPPMGLGYLASSLKKSGIAVDILDCVQRGYDYPQFADFVKEYNPDVVGFSSFSHDLPSVERSIGLVKEVNTRIVTFVGGSHPSARFKEIWDDYPSVDYGFRGEGEVGFLKIIEYLSGVDEPWNKDLLDESTLRSVSGLIWKSNGKVCCNNQAFPGELDSIAFPAWELIDLKGYQSAPQGVIFKKQPVAPMIITRGCPFLCTFCAGFNITGRKLRYRTIDNVMEEIGLLYHKYNVREIHILDDNFTLDKEFTNKFCEELIRRKFDVSWCCPNGLRLDSLDREILVLMRKAGCYYVSIGIESGSQRVLDMMKKKLKIFEIKRQVDMARSVGLDVNGFFILGYPGETIDDIRKTIDFARELDLSRAAFYNFLPLPGTSVYEDLLEGHKIDGLDWTKMTQWDVPYVPDGMKADQLKEFQRSAFLKFYLRPIIFYRLLREIKSISQLKFIVKRAWANLFSI
jgi:radical SAM superfamily enzyme YgiQ (UPF0313 family)